MLSALDSGHWRLDNKAKVINWWWLDSNSRVRLDMSQCHFWHHHKSQMIFWHYGTQTNFHLTPSPATHALHEPEPTYWANSQISIPEPPPWPTFPNRHVDCGVQETTQQSLCVQEMLPRSSLFVCSRRSFQKHKDPVNWWYDKYSWVFYFMYLMFMFIFYSCSASCHNQHKSFLLNQN